MYGPSRASLASGRSEARASRLQFSRRPCRRSVTRSGKKEALKTSQASPQALEELCDRLDELLGPTEQLAGAEQQALAAVAAAQTAGVVAAYGAARQLPKRIYTIDELRLNKVEPEKLLSPEDTSLDTIRNIGRAAAFSGLAALAVATDFDGGKILAATVALLFTLMLDQVANAGGGEALLVDSLGRLLQPSYRQRVALHEAGHLLVAYLLGLLPRAYTLSSLDAFTRYRKLNVQAGCQFCDAGLQTEVASGRLSGSSLDKYTCVALAGVVTEYLRFGQAEGGLADVQQLDRLFSALQFTQLKADGQVRWAVLNVAGLLRRHAALQDELAAAMQESASVGACVRLIETRLRDVAAAEGGV